MPLDLSADERKELAQDLAAELDTGRYGSRFVLSRRQLLSIAGGSAGVAGLTALGVDPATAQSAAGQVGTSSSPEDVFAFDLDVQGALQRDLDAGGQAITNAGSVSTNDLSVSTEQVNGVFAEPGVSITQDSTNDILEITGFDGLIGHMCELALDIRNSSAAGEYTLRFNGDGDGNGNYAYWDETGTKITGADGILLFDTYRSSPHCESHIRASTGGGWPGINHQFNPGRSKTTSFSMAGGRPGQAGGISSIEIHFPQAVDFSEVNVDFLAIKRTV